MEHTPRDQGSVSLNASYHKKQQYIWFNGGDLNGSEILSLMWTGGGWAYPLGTQGWCHWMHLIIMNNNIYGLGVRFWTVSETLRLTWNEGGGVYSWGTHSRVSLNASFHNKQHFWFRGGVLNGFWDIKLYMNWRGWVIPPGQPRLVSLNVSYHKEQQYIWFRVGFRMISEIVSLIWTGAHPRGTPVGVIGCILS